MNNKPTPDITPNLAISAYHVLQQYCTGQPANCKEYRFYEQKVTESVRKEKNELRQKQHPSHENGRHKKDTQKNVQSPPRQKD